MPIFHCPKGDLLNTGLTVCDT